jgi:hypothetical protein
MDKEMPMSDRYTRVSLEPETSYGPVTITRGDGSLIRMIPTSQLSRTRSGVAPEPEDDDVATVRPKKSPHLRNYPTNQPPVARASAVNLYPTVPPRGRKSGRPVRRQNSEASL